jgi:hypothetical protein
LVEQKMEREKLEKLRRKADKDKAEAAKRAAAAGKVLTVVINSPKVLINYLCVWLCAD